MLGIQLADYTDAKIFGVRLLVCGYGATVNGQDWVGRTALAHCMSDESLMPIASLFVDDCGADIHIKDFRGLSCLHRAVLDQSGIELLEFCIERGVGVDDLDFNGLTPLMMAVVARKIHFVRVLVEKGADLLTTQKRGWTGQESRMSVCCCKAKRYLLSDSAA